MASTMNMPRQAQLHEDGEYRPSVFDEVSQEVITQEAVAATDGSLKGFFRRVGEYGLLNSQAEVELAKDIEAGVYAQHLLEQSEFGEYSEEDLYALQEIGSNAMERMVCANIRFVTSRARRMTYLSTPLPDRIQEGVFGLMHAVKTFDYTKGYKFSTYSARLIDHSMSRADANTSRTIRLPVHVWEKLQAIERLKREFIAQHHREPTQEELSDQTGYSAKKIAELEESRRDATSYNELAIGLDGDKEREMMIADSGADAEFKVRTRDLLKNSLYDLLQAKLTENEYYVIMRRNNDVGFAAIGEELNLTRQRIQQIHNGAYKKIREDAALRAFAQDFLSE